MKGNDMAEIEDIRLDAERHARLAPITTPPPDIEGDMLRKLVAWQGGNKMKELCIRIDMDGVQFRAFDYGGWDGTYVAAPTLPALAAKLDEWLAGQANTDAGRLEERT
jgi:hypothetical protein